MTELKLAINNLISAINEQAKSLYATANQRKAELKTAVANMDAAAEDLSQFSNTLNELRCAVATTAEQSAYAVTHIDEMLSDMNVYDTEVENFDGYCDHCGKELNVNNPPHFYEEDYVCETCFDNITAENTNEEKSE